MKSNMLKFVFLSLLAASAAQADVLHWGGGHADLADDTALPTTGDAFSGVWNATTKNWATSPAPGTYGAFVQGALADLGYVYMTTDSGKSAVITNESDLVLSGLMSVTAGNNFNQRITLKAPSPRTITFTGDEALVYAFATDTTRGLSVESSVSFAGSAPWLLTSPLGVFITKSSANVNSGAMNLQGGGEFTLSDGAMPLVPEWNLAGQLFLGASSQSVTAPILRVYCSSSGSKNMFKDDAVFTLNNGHFSLMLSDNATTPTTETLGKLVLEPNGTLSLSALYNGVENPGTVELNPTLTLSDPTCGIDRGESGRGALIVAVPDQIFSWNKGMARGRPTADVVVSNGVATGTLLPWIPTTCSEFMQVNPGTKILEPVPSTLAPADPNTWASGGNYRCGTNSAWVSTATLTNNLAINSLGFWLKTSNGTLTIDTGKTLDISSGGLTRHNSSGVYVTTTITGGALTSSSGQLVITSGNYGGLTINSAITGSGMELIKAGGGITLAGADSNTYDGTTYVSGALTVNKTGSAVAIPGDLVILPGGRFGASGNAPISSTSAVTIQEGGVWSQGSSATTHGAPITIEGGCYYLQNVYPSFSVSGTGLHFNGGRITHYSSANGGINLQTDVNYASSATRQARWEQLYGNTGLFTVKLNGARRTFDVADSATLPTALPEMVVDTRIADGFPAGGSIRKSGTGVLQFTDNNTYTGGTVVDGGTLRVSTISAPALSGLAASCSSASSALTFNLPVATNLVIRQVVRSASNTGLTASKNVTDVLNPFQVVLTGTGGTARPTDIQADAVSRSGSLGTGAATVNAGTLKIDPGIDLANAVTVNAGGTIDASGATIGSLTVNGGTVAATPSAGALSASGAVSLTNTALTLTGNVDNAPMTLLSAGSITGKFASIPEKVSVRYYPTYVTVERMKGLVIVVR